MRDSSLILRPRLQERRRSIHRMLQTVDHTVNMKSSIVDQGKVLDVSFKRSALWQLLVRRIFSCIK
jgi:hypothetical protein